MKSGHGPKRIKRVGEKGSAYLSLIGLALLLGITFFTLYYQLYVELKASRDFQRQTIAYYGAEAGLRLAMRALRARAPATAAWEGRVGQAVYQSEVRCADGEFRLVSRGFYLPQREGRPVDDLARGEKGGGYKNTITVTGRLLWEGLTIEGWECYP